MPSSFSAIRAPEEVADDDRPGRQGVDEVRVVTGDVVDAVVGDAVRVRLASSTVSGSPGGLARPAHSPPGRTALARAPHEEACSHRPWMTMTGVLALVIIVCLSHADLDVTIVVLMPGEPEL
jgi:hypothetical protein